MYFDDVGTHIGPEAFVWEGKTDVYVQPKPMAVCSERNIQLGLCSAQLPLSLLSGWREGWCFC